MMRSLTRRIFALAIPVLLAATTLLAQPVTDPGKPAKPYKVLTSGKQVTVKSTRAMKNLMVWTSSGNRIVEQRDLNQSSYSFRADIKGEKYFFLMVQYDGMKPFTEKIGIN